MLVFHLLLYSLLSFFLPGLWGLWLLSCVIGFEQCFPNFPLGVLCRRERYVSLSFWGVTQKDLPKAQHFGVISYFILSCCMACRILVSWPGIKFVPLQWKHGVLTTGPLGKSLWSIIVSHLPLWFTFLPYSHLFYYKNVYFPKFASRIDVFGYFIEHTCPTAVWLGVGVLNPDEMHRIWGWVLVLHWVLHSTGWGPDPGFLLSPQETSNSLPW